MKKLFYSRFSILFIIGVVFLSFSWIEDAKGQASAGQAGNNIPKPDIQPTELWSRGYSVIPSPRNVKLEEGEVLINEGWNIKVDGVPRGDITVDFMKKDLKEFHGLELKGTANRVISLQVKTGTVKTGGTQEIEKDAYRIVVKPGDVSIVGNSPSGMFYGAQTFLQLLKVLKDGNVVLPECTITDWPATELRMIHWDTKNHQDRIETLKRYLDWTARFKMNGIAFEIWDKFVFPSHPVIGVPEAFTPQQLQDLVDYGLARHIQIIPDVQAPAHFSWVLRHPEFAHLKSDIRGWDEACICDERTYELIFELYDDLIKSTRGVDYLLASTDELFTVGACDKCDKPYTPENKSLYFVEFVNRADNYLRSKGRKTIAWLEFPLLTEHVKLLNPEIIDGVAGHLGYFVDDKAFIDEENKKGIKIINYTPIQGGASLFPPFQTRYNTFEDLSYGLAWRGDVIGTFIAAWDDAALHNETFWLGWATGAQYSWSPGKPSVEQTTMEFMNIYYGPEATDMVDVYRILDEGARFYQSSVRKLEASDIRRSGIDWGGVKYKSTVAEFEQRRDVPSLPPLPNMEDPTYTPAYREKFTGEIKQAGEMKKENELLRHKIQENILKTDRNDYNLRVLLSLTDLIRHHMDLITGLASVEDSFKSAVETAQKGDPPSAITQLNDAKDQIKRIIEDRENTFKNLKETYGVSQIHSARHDLSFMISREKALNLEEYVYILEDIIKEYGEKNSLDGFYDKLESRPRRIPAGVY
jgi:hexosaminidase